MAAAVEMVEAVEMVDHHVGQIPKGTSKADLETVFNEYGGIVRYFKDGKFPYAFIDIPEDKVEALSEAEIKVGETVLQIDPAFKSIKYFLDSRETEGSLDELTKEKLTEYFAKFGAVVEAKIVEGKNFGFLKMKKEEGNKEVERLAFNLHTIDGQEINVKEQDNSNKRKRNNKRRWNGRGKKQAKKLKMEPTFLQV